MSKTELAFAKTIPVESNLPVVIDEAASTIRISFMDVIGFGDLIEVSLRRADDTVVTIDGPLHLVSLAGRIRKAGDQVVAQYRAVVDGPNGMASGILEGGRSTHLELTFLALVKPIEHHAYQPQATGGRAGWGDAMALSAALEKRPENRSLNQEEESAGLPEQGDVVQHRQFGDCKVAALDDEHITVQKPNGRVVQLGLKVMRFVLLGSDGAHQVWRAEVRRR